MESIVESHGKRFWICGWNYCTFFLSKQHEILLLYKHCPVDLIEFYSFKILKGLKYYCDSSVDSSALQPKLLATCQSSVELISHLSTTLISESHVSEECARTSEVCELTARYDHLVSQARAREQRIRESK